MGRDSLNYRADLPDISPKEIIYLGRLRRRGKQANDAIKHGALFSQRVKKIAPDKPKGLTLADDATRADAGNDRGHLGLMIKLFKVL